MGVKKVSQRDISFSFSNLLKGKIYLQKYLKVTKTPSAVKQELLMLLIIFLLLNWFYKQYHKNVS